MLACFLCFFLSFFLSFFLPVPFFPVPPFSFPFSPSLIPYLVFLLPPLRIPLNCGRIFKTCFFISSFTYLCISFLLPFIYSFILSSAYLSVFLSLCLKNSAILSLVVSFQQLSCTLSPLNLNGLNRVLRTKIDMPNLSIR
jgi:hypothetical protein